VSNARNVPNASLVMLRLEAEVSLAHDDDFGELEHSDLTDAFDVAQNKLELLGWFCKTEC